MTKEDMLRQIRIKERRRKILEVIRFILIFFILMLFMFPVYWTFIGAFKSMGEFYHYPPLFWPKQVDLNNFKRALFDYGGLKGLIDSLIIASLNTIIVIGLGVFLAYSMGRYRFGGDSLSFFVLSLLFAPPVIVTIPLFLIFKSLRMLDTYQVLVLSYILFNLPFATWIIKGFFEDIPREIENAALLDGYSRFMAFWKYVLPLALPGIAVTALFVFIFSWNEFLFALIFTRSAVQTLPVTLAGMIGGHMIKWGELSALSLIAITPGILLALFFQRYLIRGLTFGAIKG